jgi:hypothetical protein
VKPFTLANALLSAGVVSVALAFANAAAAAPPDTLAARLSPERQAAEATFMRSVKRHQTADDMTADVLAHTGEHVAYRCEIEEITRPGLAVGQCGALEEPVDLYIEMPPGTWRVGETLRVLGIMDAPASWSDVSGHTIYYPFVKAMFVDRIR